MKRLGIALLVSGIGLIGLSGLEKVLIFVAVSSRTIQIEGVKGLTPPYIWGITNLTFFMGLFLSILGSVFFARKSEVINSTNGTR